MNAAPTIVARKDRATAKQHAEVLKQRAAALPASAYTEAEVWDRCRTAARRVAFGSSQPERDAIASETAERIFRRLGVRLADGWRVPRGLATAKLLQQEARKTWERSPRWRDVADGPEESLNRDRWDREQPHWIAPTHGVDSGDLADRVAQRFPQQRRATVARFLLAGSEAVARDDDGKLIYGPDVAARLDCSQQTLRKSVERGRQYVTDCETGAPDPGDLADWIAADAADLADERDPLQRWRSDVPDPRGNASLTLTASHAALNPPQRWQVVGRACAILPRGTRVTYRERERPAGPGLPRIRRAERPAAYRDTRRMREAPTGAERLDCAGQSYPAGLRWSGDTRRPGALWPDDMIAGQPAYGKRHPGRERERVAHLADLADAAAE